MPQKFEIAWKDPEKLIPYEKNAKIHSEEQIESIAKQLDQGWDQPIVVDESMVILKGHGRRLAAIKRFMVKVPVLVRDDLSSAQKKAIRLADNKVAEAPWDPELLRLDLGELMAGGFGMDLTGFALPQIEDILNPKTSEQVFTARDHRDVNERYDEYQNSGMRQVILVMEPERFQTLMERFASGQAAFGVETNVEVVERLFEFYETHRIRV